MSALFALSHRDCCTAASDKNDTADEPSTRTKYTYDSLNRLSTLSDSATGQICKGLSWIYDAWGNRTDQNVKSGSCNAFHALVGTNNQFGSPYRYDAAGNMTYDGAHTYTYDAENRLTQVDGGATSYVYDAQGHRVRKNSGSTWSEYVYDTSGNVLAEWKNTVGWLVAYVYMNGRFIAQYQNNTTYSVLGDHLGSTRLLTNLDHSVYDSLDFDPFGEQIAGDTGTTHKFTGKERDSESGLDNFEARYLGSSMGRFMSPDPLGGHQEDPQTLNRYVYARNNPLNLVDPTGLDFNLTCKDESETCHGGLVGTYSKPDDNGNRTFAATVISNDKNGNLVDQNENQYGATVSGAGVSFTQAGSNQSSMGVFINGTNPTTVQDPTNLPGFTFNFTYSNMASGVNAGGTFTYSGTDGQAENALSRAGFQHYFWDESDPFHPSNAFHNAFDMRTPGAQGTGAGSGHVTVFEPWIVLEHGIAVPLKDTIPTTGTVHLGEHNAYTGGLIDHTIEVLKYLFR